MAAGDTTEVSPQVEEHATDRQKLQEFSLSENIILIRSNCYTWVAEFLYGISSELLTD